VDRTGDASDEAAILARRGAKPALSEAEGSRRLAYVGALHLKLTKKQDLSDYVALAMKTLIPPATSGTV